MRRFLLFILPFFFFGCSDPETDYRYIPLTSTSTNDVVVYACNYCGQTYSTADEAEDCYASHQTPTGSSYFQWYVSKTNNACVSGVIYLDFHGLLRNASYKFMVYHTKGRTLSFCLSSDEYGHILYSEELDTEYQSGEQPTVRFTRIIYENELVADIYNN